jgi:hypothetical protein
MEQLSLFPRTEIITDQRPKWFQSPVNIFKDKIEKIRTLLPVFERRPFELPPSSQVNNRVNPYFETVVRKPINDDKNFIPVGTVSKKYILIQHEQIFDAAVDALNNAGIKTADIDAELKITDLGERMALNFYLPDEYSYTIGNDDKMAMRLECFNSVEGSVRFWALLGWFRYVCSNGIVVGITKTNFHHRHTGDLEIGDIQAIMSHGIATAKKEQKNLEQWQEWKIQEPKISRWVDKVIRKTWNFKAAARVYHIAHTGFDAEVEGAYKDFTPSTVWVNSTRRVPGAPQKAQNAFDISQILAWIARTRHDIQEQVDWRQKIPGLMQELLNR